MTEPVLSDMNYPDFRALLERYIERSSQANDDLPTSAFLHTLLRALAARVRDTIEVEGRVIGGQLVLSLPVGQLTPVQVQGNQIVVDEHRIIVRLAGDPQPA